MTVRSRFVVAGLMLSSAGLTSGAGVATADQLVVRTGEPSLVLAGGGSAAYAVPSKGVFAGAPLAFSRRTEGERGQLTGMFVKRDGVTRLVVVRCGADGALAGQLPGKGGAPAPLRDCDLFRLPVSGIGRGVRVRPSTPGASEYAPSASGRRIVFARTRFSGSSWRTRIVERRGGRERTLLGVPRSIDPDGLVLGTATGPAGTFATWWWFDGPRVRYQLIRIRDRGRFDIVASTSLVPPADFDFDSIDALTAPVVSGDRVYWARWGIAETTIFRQRPGGRVQQANPVGFGADGQESAVFSSPPGSVAVDRGTVYWSEIYRSGSGECFWDVQNDPPSASRCGIWRLMSRFR